MLLSFFLMLMYRSGRSKLQLQSNTGFQAGFAGADLNTAEQIKSRLHRFDSAPRIPQWNKSPSRNSKVKKLFYIVIVAMVTPLLGGCFDNGSSAPPPSNFTATAGDGRVMLTWTASPGVEYWLFTATDPSLTAFNWTALPNAQAYISPATPFYLCGLINGTTTYFAANGRTNGGPGGTSSPTISAAPYNASNTWTPASAPLATSSTTPTNPDLLGVGYTGLTTCGNNGTISAAGVFAAVGAGGAIFTSADGMSWFNRPAPAGFSTDLYAVTGYAVNQNNPGNPALRWVAVGNGGASIYSLDGITWTDGNPVNSGSTANPGNHALRSITHVAGTFFAVGDAGTILSSTDGITWTIHNSPSVSSSKLNGVTHGGIYVAVGDSGTILISGDGNTWAVKTPTTPIASNLRQVTAFVSVYGTIYVAVGDAGTIVTSIDGGTTWIKQAAPTASDLVGITVESRGVETNTAYTTAPAVDPKLLFISSAQFVAIDSTGKTYTSVNGYDWTASATSTGISCTSGTTCMNPLVSSGFGYVTTGNSGVYATAF